MQNSEISPKHECLFGDKSEYIHISWSVSICFALDIDWWWHTALQTKEGHEKREMIKKVGKPMDFHDDLKREKR